MRRTGTCGGEPVVEHPEPGEVVWRDDAGVTCRRWNWRQGVRTRITTATTSAVFILDVLDPLADDAAHAAADALTDALSRPEPGCRCAPAAGHPPRPHRRRRTVLIHLRRTQEGPRR